MSKSMHSESCAADASTRSDVSCDCDGAFWMGILPIDSIDVRKVLKKRNCSIGLLDGWR